MALTTNLDNEILARTAATKIRWSTMFGGTCSSVSTRYFYWNGLLTSSPDTLASNVLTQYVLPYQCRITGISWQVSGASAATRFAIYSAGAINGSTFALGVSTAVSTGFLDLSPGVIVPNTMSGTCQFVFANIGSNPSGLFQLHFREV